ncbi:transcriptional adapter 2-alpha [Bacillus rossius redtenbacheri]|uniref:transcriptional adapter 2-alpha n=1 Tax=Bacillus rossius redtenbacheri TaxID=93214 RepID=UPI002FDD3E6A
MSNLNPTDLIDEDAADLQFPKGIAWAEESGGAAGPDMCLTCRTVLREPYIRCAECAGGVGVCVECFSRGAELPPHENSHAYSVVRNEFPLFEDRAWRACEELRLLDVVLDCGFGNWSEVARRVPGHSRKDCEEHFLSTYVENPELGTPGPERCTAAEPPAAWYCQSLAGYNARRGDFDMEYDEHAELAVAQIDARACEPDDPDYELCRALQVELVDGYNGRLRERRRRREIIREHGLVLTRRTVSWLQRYEGTVPRRAVERLVLCMQLTSGQDLDYVMEGLHRAGELRQCILRLQALRENGLTRFHSCRLYHRLKWLRDAQRKERRAYTSDPALCWRGLRDAAPHDGTLDRLPPVGVLRRAAQPLEIVGLPGYECLTSAERDLCSNTRLVPESYLEFKRILVSECKRQHGLKLAQARVLIKIDVNKTRKLFDFLQQEGYITLPRS